MKIVIQAYELIREDLTVIQSSTIELDAYGNYATKGKANPKTVMPAVDRAVAEVRRKVLEYNTQRAKEKMEREGK